VSYIGNIGGNLRQPQLRHAGGVAAGVSKAKKPAKSEK
jgi:hypothetical protein